NPLIGGHTPILGMQELGELGFRAAVLGLDTLMHAAKAIETVLLDMKSEHSPAATTARTSRATRDSPAPTNGNQSTRATARRIDSRRVIPPGPRTPCASAASAR